MEFRRRLLEEPDCREVRFVEHLDRCPPCARQYRRGVQLERALSEALQVTPPEGLRERLILDGRLRRHARRRLWRGAALAAGVLSLAVALSLRPLPWVAGGDPLARTLVHHIQDEAAHLHQVGPVPPERLARLFARFGARLEGSLGQVNYAGRCHIHEGEGIHLVVAGRSGPVTLLFMPGERIGAPIRVLDERFQGRILPTPYGGLALVGERGEVLEPIARRVGRALRWTL